MSEIEPRLTEVAFAIGADQHNPTLLNPDFLKRNGIVPEEWELSEPPICAFPVAEVCFRCGVSVSAHPDRALFRQHLADGQEEVLVAEVARRYVATLPYVIYEDLRIRFASLVCFPDGACGEEFVARRFLASREGLAVRGVVPRAALRLSYGEGDGRQTLALECPGTQEPDRPCSLAVTGTFSYDLGGIPDHAARVDAVRGRIEGWEQVGELYRDMVHSVLADALQALGGSSRVLDDDAVGADPLLVLIRRRTADAMVEACVRDGSELGGLPDGAPPPSIRAQMNAKWVAHQVADAEIGLPQAVDLAAVGGVSLWYRKSASYVFIECDNEEHVTLFYDDPRVGTDNMLLGYDCTSLAAIIEVLRRVRTW